MSLPPTAGKAAIKTVQSETSLTRRVIITQNIHRQPHSMEGSVSHWQVLKLS